QDFASMATSSSTGPRVFSCPRNRLATTSRFSHRARSWNTVATPAFCASLGEENLCRAPLMTRSPSSAAWTPAMTLIRVDLPAPLSPTRPTTSPRPTVRWMSVRAWTAPNRLLMPRSSSTGSLSPPGARDAAGAGSGVSDVICSYSSRSFRPERRRPDGRRRRGRSLHSCVVAELLHTAGADDFGLDLVADDVLSDGLGLDEVGRSVLVGGSAVDVLSGGQRDSGVGGEFGLRRDRLVDGRVLIPLEDVLQAVDLGVLTGDDGVDLGLVHSGDD